MPSSSPMFLSITDLHFNPCYDASIVDKLAAATPSDWEDIFSGSKRTPLPDYGTDTNFALLSSLFEDLKAYSQCRFIIFSGDFLGHNLLEKFSTSASDKSNDNFRNFISKTIEFLAMKFAQIFPGKVVFPSLGNDDSFSGDYAISLNGEFLDMFTKAWHPFLKFFSKKDRQSFESTFPAGGYYSASIPGRPSCRVIVMNNIFLSNNYANKCGKSHVDSVSKQFSWLNQMLNDCRTNNETAWIIFHEPLGIDMYSALHGKAGTCADNIKSFMKQDDATRLRMELIKWAGLIDVIFCGHTHMNEFRILHNDDQQPLAYMHVTPSISPIFANNPAYHVFDLEPKTHVPYDYSTRYLDLKQTKMGKSVKWKQADRFTRTYRKKTLNLNALVDIQANMAHKKYIRDAYVQYYNVENPANSPINPENWKAFSYGIKDNTCEEFILNYCR